MVDDLSDICRMLQKQEQGVLIELPCGIGADVYIIPSETNFRLNILHGHGELNRVYHQIVDRITVHEAEKVDGERQQTIEIYLKFIGRVEVPEPELTEEELKEQGRLREQRAKGREKARRYRERQKQKKLTEMNAAKEA